MITTTRASSPLKGVNRAFARESQPDGTCWDAQNVLPQDRYGRMRVAQRSGLGQLATLDGVSPVRLLHVAATVNPLLGYGSFLSDDFNSYANGQLDSVSSGRWDSAIRGSAIPIASLVVASGSIHSTATASARVVPTLALSPTSYTIQVSVIITSALASVQTVGIFYRFTGTGQESFEWILNKTGGVTSVYLRYKDAGGVVTDLADGGSGFGVGTHTLKIVVTGNLHQGYWDGVLAASTTNATYAAATGTGVFFQGNPNANIDDFSVTGASAPAGAVNRTTLKLVGVAGTNTYIGDPTAMAIVTASSTYPIAPGIFVDAATLFGYTYIVDGTSIHRLNLATNTMVAFTETAGTAPQNCNIACEWRGRLVLSGSPTDPQNFFASRAGDPLDWNYAATDPAAAFAGNAAASGKVGQPIQALIPVTDDILVLGCEQSMYAVRGDPTDGGAIDQVTDFAGISSSTAWTRGPDGSIYFVGPRGFFRMNPTATEVKEISQTAYPQFFQQLNRSTNFINMIYDSDRYGIWVFVTPLTLSNAATSIFYDMRFEGYWPQNLATQLDAGPVTAIYWDGYNSDTRYPVLGGYTGELYAFNLTNRTDNGGIITAYVTLGPFHPSSGESMLVGVTMNSGELSAADQSADPNRWQTSVSLFSGKGAYDVMEGTPTSRGIIDWGRDRRSKTMRQRLKGEWFAVTLSNAAAGNYFSMESLELEFDVAGKNRRQR